MNDYEVVFKKKTMIQLWYFHSPLQENVGPVSLEVL